MERGDPLELAHREPAGIDHDAIHHVLPLRIVTCAGTSCGFAMTTAKWKRESTSEFGSTVGKYSQPM